MQRMAAPSRATAPAPPTATVIITASPAPLASATVPAAMQPAQATPSQKPAPSDLSGVGGVGAWKSANWAAATAPISVREFMALYLLEVSNWRCAECASLLLARAW